MLADHGVEFERRDYFGDRFTRDELQVLFQEIGVSPGDVLSKRSKAYKELGLAERQVPDEKLLDLMVEHPTLLRRPIIVKDRDAVIGFDRDKIEALIEQE